MAVNNHDLSFFTANSMKEMGYWKNGMMECWNIGKIPH